MKKLLILTPALALVATVLTSCTTVVEKPTPSVSTSTTTRESTAIVRPSATTQTTTTRSGGY